MTTRPELDADDPIALFHQWLEAAQGTEPNDPNAAALATATAEGVPSVRMVLIKQATATGFCFYTNEGSQKGHELAETSHAALCFHWKSLRRQVRVTGTVASLPPQVSDEYFHSRSRRSQIGAAVSRQSRPLSSRQELEAEVADFKAQHEQGEIPRPNFWHGYCVKPENIEFWIDGADRLHDRLLFTCKDGSWSKTLLYP